MKNFRKTMAFLSAFALGVFACVSDFNSFDINSENVVYASEFENYQEEVIQLVNAEREKEGLQPLYTSDLLNSLGQIRAEELLEDFSHTRPDGTKGMRIIDGYGIDYSYCGENIAAGNSTPETVINQWMNSDGHRANILKSQYTHMGVGVVYDKNSEYGYYWVQIFYGVSGDIDGQYIPIAETTTTTEETTTTEITTTTEEITIPETTTTAEKIEPTLIGDATKNNIVDIRDVTLINQSIIKVVELDAKSIANADVIKDGVIDISDLGQMKKYILKLIDTL